MLQEILCWFKGDLIFLEHAHEDWKELKVKKMGEGVGGLGGRVEVEMCI